MTPGGSESSCMAALPRTGATSTTPGSGTAVGGSASSIVSNDMTVVNVEKLLVTRQCWFSARLRWSSSPNVHFDEAQCRRRGRIETKDYMKTFAFQERLVSTPALACRCKCTAAAWQLRLLDQRIPRGLKGQLTRTCLKNAFPSHLHLTQVQV